MNVIVPRVSVVLLISVVSASSHAFLTPLPATVDTEEPAALRSQAVHVDARSLRDGAKRGALAITLFDDLDIEVKLEAVVDEAPTAAWRGHIVGDPSGTFTLVQRDGVFAGTIVTNGRLFQIVPTPDATILREIDTTQLGGCDEVIAPVEPTSPEPLAPLTADDDGSLVDVMVLYTDDVVGAYGASGAQALVNLAITETNTAYEDSGVDHRLRLVHAEAVEADEFNTPGSLLWSLTNTWDGWLDQIHSMRNTYGADVVVLIVQNYGPCGSAYRMSSLSTGFASSAFSIVRASCATGYYTFGHEIGHNMSCTHDHDNSSSSLYPFGFGHRFGNNAYRTVMAYSPGTRILRFSNPDRTYAGYDTGVPVGQSRQAHNALAMNLTSPTVALFRASTFTDCNDNGLHDLSEIALGKLEDNDGDDIPDVCQASFILADMNCDGAVNAGDIDGFVLAVTDTAGYIGQFPECDWRHGDCTDDGLINAGDIDCFVDAVVSGG